MSEYIKKFGDWYRNPKSIPATMFFILVVYGLAPPFVFTPFLLIFTSIIDDSSINWKDYFRLLRMVYALYLGMAAFLGVGLSIFFAPVGCAYLLYKGQFDNAIKCLLGCIALYILCYFLTGLVMVDLLGEYDNWPSPFQFLNKAYEQIFFSDHNPDKY